MESADRCDHDTESIEWKDIRTPEVGAPRAYGVCTDCGEDVVGFVGPIATLASGERAEKMQENA